MLFRLCRVERVSHANCVEHLCAGHEDSAAACGKEEPAAGAGICREIAFTALHSARRERICDNIDFPSGLDNEQATDIFPHANVKARNAPAAELRAFVLSNAVNCKLTRQFSYAQLGKQCVPRRCHFGPKIGLAEIVRRDCLGPVARD